MFNNYFLLRELSLFLGKNLAGFKINEIFSQEKDKLVLQVYKGDNVKFLEFCCKTEFPYLVFYNKYGRRKSNFATLFSDLYELEIDSVLIYENERIIELNINSKKLLFIFIPVKLNLLCVDKNTIVNAFKNYNRINNLSTEEFLKTKQKNREKKYRIINDYLKINYGIYGSLLQDEVLHSVNLKRNEFLNDDCIKLIDDGFLRINEQLEKPKYLLYNYKNEYLISLIKLNHLQDIDYTSFENVNELIKNYLTETLKKNKINDIINEKLKYYEKKIKPIKNKIHNLKKNIDEAITSDKYLYYGNMILSNVELYKKGVKEMEVCDEATGKIFKIRTKPELSAVENANIYFEKYKKLKSSVSVLNEKVKKYEMELSKLQKQINDINKTSDIKEIKKMEKELETKSNEENELKMFRKFKLSGEFQIWVGKSSASNDLLTKHYSSPDDYWFHVRGTSGSHTVLKSPKKQESIPKNIIESAASIAAYYSKARNASSVPVAYCLRKYVKKKKGFKEGSVIMEREKIIYVKPQLPPETEI